MESFSDGPVSLSGVLGLAFNGFWLVEVGVMVAWSLLTPRPSSNIKALVFLVLGEVTPSWSSFTRGSADRGLRLTTEHTSLWLELGLGLALEDSWSDGIFSLGLGADDDDSEEEDEDDDGLGVSEEPGLPVGSLETGLGMSPELRAGLELL